MNETFAASFCDLKIFDLVVCLSGRHLFHATRYLINSYPSFYPCIIPMGHETLSQVGRDAALVARIHVKTIPGGGHNQWMQ